MNAGIYEGQRSRRFERIGHRGAPNELHENTMASFERALARGADAIELDVHSTADGVVVVHHDAVLSRRAEPDGMPGAAIATNTWSDISTAQVAPGLGIPTLAEVLELVGGRAIVYVEIKGRGIERQLTDTIARSSCACAVHSFDHDAIARMSVLAPAIPRGVLFDRYPGDLASVVRYTRARDVWPTWRFINSRLVETVHGLGARVIAWTVNSAATAFQLASFGVDGICSDDLRQIR